MIRKVRDKDRTHILELYKLVARTSGGIARKEAEIDPAYIAVFVEKAMRDGIGLVATDEQGCLLGEIHCYRLAPQILRHVLSELTIVVHPDFQSKGVGRQLFTRLLMLIEETRDDILRVELLARESNRKAISLYEMIGFTIEGRFERRIENHAAELEADIPMAWFNKYYGRRNSSTSTPAAKLVKL